MAQTQLSYPLINGNRFSFASIEVNVAGRPYRGVKSIDYENALERAKQWGTSSRALGRTRGKYDPTLSLEVFKEEAHAIRSALVAAGGGAAGYGEVAFDITVVYEELGGAGIITDKAIGCVIEKDGDSHSQSADGLSEKWTINVMDITRNGLSMLSSTTK